MYLIHTDYFYHDIEEDVEEKFDTSNYPDIHSSGIKTGVNERDIGKFKNVVGGNQIILFIGLRPKLYTFKVELKYEKDKEDGKIKVKINVIEKDERKGKGIKKNVIKKSLTFEDYKKCLFSEEVLMKEMNVLRSENHDIYSMTINKVALSANDDKRLICCNKINTLALSPLTDKIKEYCVINKNDLFRGRDSPIYKYSEEIQRWYKSLLSNS